MVEEKTSKKKQLILMVVGLAFLLVLVIGATYAYFTFTSQNDFKDPATIEGSMGELGAGVTLTRAEDSTLTLNLSAADMLVENAQTYYASGSETPKTIATVHVDGAGYYNCTYSLEITNMSYNSEKDLYTKLSSLSGRLKSQYANQFYFTINDTKYDLTRSDLFDENGKLLYNGTISFVTSAADVELTANMVIINSETRNQTRFNDSVVNLSINATEFNCEVVDTNMKASVNSITKTNYSVDSITVLIDAEDAYGIESYTFQINNEEEVTQQENTYTFENLSAGTEYEITTSVTNKFGNSTDPETTIMRTSGTVAQVCPGSSISNCIEYAVETGLQKEVFEGDELFRYVGNQGNTGINNYICLGATSCTSGDDNMYRIIGVNPETNELKVIKETVYSTQTPWYDNFPAGVPWEQSHLYNLLNTTWLENISFGDLIVAKTWDIGDIRLESESKSKSGVLTAEQKVQTTNTAKVGALSMTDYYLAHTEDRNWRDVSGKTNWIHGSNNGNTSNIEWTMTRYGYYSSYYNAWYVNSEGRVGYIGMSYYRAARPVFFLTSELQYASGEGTAVSPFSVKLNSNE